MNAENPKTQESTGSALAKNSMLRHEGGDWRGWSRSSTK